MDDEKNNINDSEKKTNKQLNFEGESDEEENSEESKDSKDFIQSSSNRKISSNELHQKLERIHENDDEENISVSMTKDFEKQNSQEIISSLRTKIIELEDKVISLKEKNDELLKNNIKNSSMLKRMSHVGIRRVLSFTNQKGNESIKFAILLKEKNDLQEINEKMLNMLTDKELENEELQENFDKYKSDIKKEITKYLETIDNLEEKIEILEENNQNHEKLDDNLDKITDEYNKYKTRMENSLKEYIQKEEDLKTELENKEGLLRKMKSDLQNLEIENIQLQNQTEQREKAHDRDMINVDKIIIENEKLKAENNTLEEIIKTNEEKSQMIINSKEEEIKNLNQDLDFNKKNLLKIKEEKSDEISILKSEINKFNRDINNLVKRNDALEKEDKEIKEKNTILQNKLDKKTKELQEINDSAKKLIDKKEVLIQNYEAKLNDLLQEKNKLIEQNHELLDRIKNMSTKNLGDILNDDEDKELSNDDSENNFLRTEIKDLRERLQQQAQDLVTLNAMENEVKRLKMDNDKLAKDYKSLKEKINKQKYEETADDLMKTIKESRKNLKIGKKARKSEGGIKVKEFFFSNKIQLEKQVDTLKQMIEDEKKNYENEIDKFKGDIAVWKVKYLNQELENETLIAKYKNIIKSINVQCK